MTLLLSSDDPPPVLEDEPKAWQYVEHALIVLPGVSWEEWTTLWSTVHQTSKSAQFWVGDALLAGQREFGERFAQIVDPKYINQQRGAMWVCSRIEPSRRKANLSYSLHRELAALDPAEQDRWLALAAADDWTVKDLKEAMARRGNGGPPLEDSPPQRNGSTRNDDLAADSTFGSVEEVTGEPMRFDLEAAERALVLARPIGEAEPRPALPAPRDAAAIRATIAQVRRVSNDLALGRDNGTERLVAELDAAGHLNVPGLSLLSYESAIRTVPDPWTGKIAIEFGEQVFGGRLYTVTLINNGRLISTGVAPTLPCAIVDACLSALI